MDVLRGGTGLENWILRGLLYSLQQARQPVFFLDPPANFIISVLSYFPPLHYPPLQILLIVPLECKFAREQALIKTGQAEKLFHRRKETNGIALKTAPDEGQLERKNTSIFIFLIFLFPCYLRRLNGAKEKHGDKKLSVYIYFLANRIQ